MEHDFSERFSRDEPLFNAPVHIDFDMTNACNLACHHCHAASGKRQPNELSTLEIKDAITQMHNNGVIDLTIAGGEPFLRPDLTDILSHTGDCAGLYTTVVTNGTLLKRDIVKKLARHCSGINFNISIDGSPPNKLDILRHRKNRDKIRREQLFSQILAGAKSISNAGLTLGVSFVVSGMNADDLENVYDMAVHELGAESVTAIRFFPAGYGKNALNELALDYDTWEKMLLDLTRRHTTFSKLSVSVSAPWEIYLPLLHNGYSPQQVWDIWRYRSTLTDPVYSSEHQTGDASGIGDLNISSNGMVYPSVLMAGNQKVLCGNIREHSLQDIWYNSPVLKKLRKLRLSEIGAPCMECHIRDLCGAGSRARALSVTGKISGLDYWCPVIAEKYRGDNVIILQRQ
ncbi:radical SAM/SPASM domain-containing protein [Photorhabdus heterorhabditis]|uniref:Radical SAM protein n=1 Tax=Photorhabdus heterorhabditis TaxID=880156 RepID=A0A5B0WYM4_9GAMM|nr:radical SAM protein [Photorhabdus heterorhabditis]KAA1192133.1 radical SAM protein [Photorhabdus heterorhabditis]